MFTRVRWIACNAEFKLAPPCRKLFQRVLSHRFRITKLILCNIKSRLAYRQNFTPMFTNA